MRKIDNTSLAYTAGIIDGEGCIKIGKFNRKDRGHPYYRIYVSVCNTNKWLIEWLRFMYGGSISSLKKPAPAKDSWDWGISTRQAKDFLELILPYLKIKRPQAELAIQFQQRRIKFRPRKTAEQYALDEAQKILMHKYNRRGRPVEEKQA